MTVTALPTSGHQPSQPTGEEPDRLRAAGLAHGDLLAAARLLYVAQETYRRTAGDETTAQRVARARADLLAVASGEDTPSEKDYADLAADASAAVDEANQFRLEVAQLREELDNLRGGHGHEDPRLMRTTATA